MYYSFNPCWFPVLEICFINLLALRMFRHPDWFWASSHVREAAEWRSCFLQETRMGGNILPQMGDGDTRPSEEHTPLKSSLGKALWFWVWASSPFIPFCFLFLFFKPSHNVPHIPGKVNKNKWSFGRWIVILILCWSLNVSNYANPHPHYSVIIVIWSNIKNMRAL